MLHADQVDPREVFLISKMIFLFSIRVTFEAF